MTQYHIPFATRHGMFDLMRLTPDMFELEDVAAALAKLNRFGGRTSYPWSVAAHSLLVYELSGRTPWALFHDVHETVLGDVTSPAAKLCEVYGGPKFSDALSTVRMLLDAQISTAFGVEIEDCHKADKDACALELQALFQDAMQIGDLEITIPELHDQLGRDYFDSNWTWQDWAAKWLDAARPLIRSKGVIHV